MAIMEQWNNESALHQRCGKLLLRLLEDPEKIEQIRNIPIEKFKKFKQCNWSQVITLPELLMGTTVKI